MKKILLIVALFAGLVSTAQNPYTKINDRFNWLAGYFRSLHIPAGCGRPTLAPGQWNGSGAYFLDSCNNKVYYYNQGVWKYQPDSAAVASLGGGGGSFQQSTDLGNTTTKGIIVGQKDSIGNVFTYPWNTNPMTTWTVSHPLTTYTASSSGTTVDSGRLDQNNYLETPLRYGAENFTIRDTIIAVHKYSTDWGFGYVINNTVGSGYGAHFRFGDSAFLVYNTTGVPSTSNDNTFSTYNFYVNAGDTLYFQAKRQHRTYDISITNARNGTKLQFYRDNVVFNSVGTLRIYAYGGKWKHIGNMTIRYDEYFRPQVAVIGNSIEWGSLSQNETYNWVNQATAGFTTVSMGAPSEASLHGTYRINDIIYTVKPTVFIDAMVVNDVNGAVNIDSFSARHIRIDKLARDSGMQVIIVNAVPQVSNAATYNDTLRAIANRYGCHYVDIYTELKKSGQVYMDDKYSGDGIHPTQYGHDKIAAMVRRVLDSLIQPFYPLNLARLPMSPKFLKEVVYDQYGQAAFISKGTNPGYLWNRGGQTTVDNTMVQQPFTASTIGDIWEQCNCRWSPPGTSIASAPTVKLDAVNGLSVTQLTSTGFFYTPSVTTLATNPVNITTGAIFKPQNIPMTVQANGFGTSKNILSLNSAPSTWSITDTLLAVHRADTIKFNVDAFGGARANWLSGYRGPIDYSVLGANDWVTWKHLDSIRAALVAGSGGVSIYDDGSGFDGTISSGHLSLKTQYNKGQVMFARNDNSMNGTDSLAWISGQLGMPNYHTTLPQLRVGDVGIQSFAINNHWFGSAYYSSGFKYITSGSYAPMLYYNAGHIELLVTASTGSAGAAATHITGYHMDRATGNSGFLLTTPREAVDVNGQVSIRTVNAGAQTSKDSMLVAEDGRVKSIRGDQTLDIKYTDIGNVGGGEDDLDTYTIPAAKLSTNGDRIEFEGVYNFTGANTKTLKLYFGSQLLTSVGPGISTAFIRITGTIIRTGATTQIASITMTSSSVTYAYNVDISSPAETLSGTVVLKSTGTATADNDIVQKSMVVKFYPAP